MSKDSQGEPPSKRPAASAEESLNEALSDLEFMLQTQDEDDEDKDKDKQRAPTPAREPEGQPLPLLEEVVIPGGNDLEQRDPINDESLAESDAHARIIERLASEIEVIVQTEMEDALERSRERIRRQVQDHIEIMLPEILAELGEADSSDLDQT